MFYRTGRRLWSAARQRPCVVAARREPCDDDQDRPRCRAATAPRRTLAALPGTRNFAGRPGKRCRDAQPTVPLTGRGAVATGPIMEAPPLSATRVWKCGFTSSAEPQRWIAVIAPARPPIQSARARRCANPHSARTITPQARLGRGRRLLLDLVVLSAGAHRSGTDPTFTWSSGWRASNRRRSRPTVRWVRSGPRRGHRARAGSRCGPIRPRGRRGVSFRWRWRRCR